MVTFVIAKDGTRLMPTYNVKKVRKLLRSGRAKIYKLEPFTIQLKYETEQNVQSVSEDMDTGYAHPGLSIKSEKHEYVSAEYELLPNEKERRDDRRQYRRARRNRKRHRKARFNKDTKPEGWFAPSIKNRADRQIALIDMYMKVCPITSITLEMGQFDVQILTALEKGLPIPESVDYQYGPRYGFDTLREAVFARDGYTCVCCGISGIPKNNKKGAILRVHHLGYRNNDHSDRMDNLATVCTSCHTPNNHAKGGKLYDLKPNLKPKKGAAFMNAVKWYIYNELKKRYGDIVHMTYGAVTKRTRLDRNIEKSHANDAYCIGEFYPKHRAKTRTFKKVRRHNRILSKFYDAVYIDKRDGSQKKGAELPSGRINRNHNLDGENLHQYRGEKIRKGKTVLRTKTYDYSQGDVVRYKDLLYVASGMNRNGAGIVLKRKDKKVNPSPNQVKRIRRSNGWQETLN